MPPSRMFCFRNILAFSHLGSSDTWYLAILKAGIYLNLSQGKGISQQSMIERQDFYHGAALLRIIEDPRCLSLIKDSYGYVVNGERFVYLKYSTRNRSPWGFSVTADELRQLRQIGEQGTQITCGFVCGGDGICGVPWPQVQRMLNDEPGWISVRRGFAGRYSVSGPADKLAKKVPINQWPSIIFEAGGFDGECG